MQEEQKMKIEIWSDVMCPFCYIGKRRLDKALSEFNATSHLEIIWKSYQLSPQLKTNPDQNIHQYLALHKGITEDEAKSLNNQVAKMAEGEGLVYNFDKMVVANSFKAHQFTHFAKQFHKQGEAEEKLFEAYFTKGLNIDDQEVLVRLGTEIGLDAQSLKEVLENGKFAEEVRADMEEAFQIGVQGVPFFVFNRKYAISGAQDIRLFHQTLETAFGEWRQENQGSGN